MATRSLCCLTPVFDSSSSDEDSDSSFDFSSSDEDTDPDLIVSLDPLRDLQELVPLVGVPFFASRSIPLFKSSFPITGGPQNLPVPLPLFSDVQLACIDHNIYRHSNTGRVHWSSMHAVACWYKQPGSVAAMEAAASPRRSGSS